MERREKFAVFAVDTILFATAMGLMPYSGPGISMLFPEHIHAYWFDDMSKYFFVLGLVTAPLFLLSLRRFSQQIRGALVAFIVLQLLSLIGAWLLVQQLEPYFPY